MASMGLYLTAFLCGAAIMLLEMLGFRLLPPYFGYSIAVWGALLGVVMVALAAGYYAGGSLADRHPRLRTLYLLILAAAGYALLLLFAYPAILGYSARFDLVPGALFASLLLFGVPMGALSTVSPFVIRLLAREQGVGRVAGSVYAVSTLGSIAGTFLTAFYLVPLIGTRATLLVGVISLALVGGLGILASAVPRKAWRASAS
jgi:MFS family permease